MSKAVPTLVVLAILTIPIALAGQGPGAATLIPDGAPAGPALAGVGAVFPSVIPSLNSWTLHTGAYSFSCDGAISKGVVRNALGEVVRTGVACSSALSAVPMTYNVQFGKFFVGGVGMTMAGSIVSVPMT